MSYQNIQNNTNNFTNIKINPDQIYNYFEFFRIKILNVGIIYLMTWRVFRDS